ncbi:hypothetical protein [Streptomyces sp. GS7]|uniref:hypothetical protein n=1 Tax=Streptomyces sp. GS7 TaxID=2692234 RepID=UPI0013179EDD|nr:hypothetical protein [Streptomyces sp. GS7]QHC22988.1 hypothetical protein GR130_17740 [Streptomyces sp. GS7]
MDDEWCELLAARSVEVTISIDGPSQDNALRADSAGRPTTRRTLEGIRRLQHHGIPFGIIAVVRDPVPATACRLYAFARELGASALGVNLAERKGVHQPGQPGIGTADFWGSIGSSLACRIWPAHKRLRPRSRLPVGRTRRTHR